MFNPIKIVWKKFYCIIVGFLAFVWFLIRVVPRPSRAAYPCQRVAFPLATTFITYILSLFASVFTIKKARKYILHQRYRLALSFMIFSAAAMIWHLNVSSEKTYA